jgi:hypothetical protein
LIDSTSHRMVYSILTRSREYSKAIHCTPLSSWRTTSGVVAGMGPGAALGLICAVWPPAVVGVEMGVALDGACGDCAMAGCLLLICSGAGSILGCIGCLGLSAAPGVACCWWWCCGWACCG